MDDKQGTPVVVYLDEEEKKVVLDRKKHEGLSNQNISIRKIIRDYGGLPQLGR